MRRPERTEEAEQLATRLFEQYQRGVTIKSLSHRFCCAEHLVRKHIREQRLEFVNGLALEHVRSQEFTVRNAESTICGQTPVAAETPTIKKISADLPAYLSELYRTPLLTPAQERHLFRKYNFLKFRASELRSTLDGANANMRTMDKIEDYYRRAMRVQRHLAKANLRLVVSLVKQHVAPTRQLPELISEGNVALLKAIEKFDYSRGFKFSTYATWAIINSVRRSIPKEQTHVTRFQTSRDEALATKGDYRIDPLSRESRASEDKQTVNRLLKHLDPREQKVISNRFGLDYTIEPKTLQEIGDLLGVSKERVRQLERRALNKLRDALGGKLEGLLA